MNIYQFLWCDGYYSFVLIHDKKFNEEEMEQIYQEAINSESMNYTEWLIREKGFKSVDYTRLNFDCGSIDFKVGDNNGRTL